MQMWLSNEDEEYSENFVFGLREKSKGNVLLQLQIMAELPA